MKWISLLPFCFCILLVNCEKDDGFSFGDPQTDLKTDTIYKENSEGLLFIYFFGNTIGMSLSLYAENNPEPQTEIAKIIWHGSITHPIKKNTYWRIDINYTLPESKVLELEIKWIPIND